MKNLQKHDAGLILTTEACNDEQNAAATGETQDPPFDRQMQAYRSTCL